MRYLLVTIVSLLAISCAPSTPKQPTDASEPPPAVAAFPGKLPDPVCEMDYDTSYHEWTVFKGDTIHFCSVTCKEVFEKAPEKYAARLKK